MKKIILATFTLAFLLLGAVFLENCRVSAQNDTTTFSGVIIQASGAQQNVFTGITAYIPYPTQNLPSGTDFISNWIGSVVGSNSVFFQVGTIIVHSATSKTYFYAVTSNNNAIPPVAQEWTDPDQTVSGRYFSLLFNGTGWGIYVDGTQIFFYNVQQSPISGIELLTEHTGYNAAIDQNVYTFKDCQVNTQYGWMPLLALPQSYAQTSFQGSAYTGDVYNVQTINASSLATGHSFSSQFAYPYTPGFQFSASPYFATPLSLSPLPIITYLAITAIATPHCSISPSGITHLNAGQSQTFIFSTENGWVISHVLVDSVDVGVLSSYTFTNIVANHTIAILPAQSNQPTSNLPPELMFAFVVFAVIVLLIYWKRK